MKYLNALMGIWPQASMHRYTPVQRSPASVGLAQAHPNQFLHIDMCMYIQVYQIFHMPCLQLFLWHYGSTIFCIFTTALRCWDYCFVLCVLSSATEECSWGRMEQCSKEKCLPSWTQGQGAHVYIYISLGGEWVVRVGVHVSWNNTASLCLPTSGSCNTRLFIV